MIRIRILMLLKFERSVMSLHVGVCCDTHVKSEQACDVVTPYICVCRDTHVMSWHRTYVYVVIRMWCRDTVRMCMSWHACDVVTPYACVCRDTHVMSLHVQAIICVSQLLVFNNYWDLVLSWRNVWWNVMNGTRSSIIEHTTCFTEGTAESRHTVTSSDGTKVHQCSVILTMCRCWKIKNIKLGNWTKS